MVHCVASSCKNGYLCRRGRRSDDKNKDGPAEVSFHEFPRDEALRALWAKNVSRANWTPAVRSVLCSNHFAPECFTKRKKLLRLKKGAVPTIFERQPSKSKPSKKLTREEEEEVVVVEARSTAVSDRTEVHGVKKIRRQSSYCFSTSNNFSITMNSPSCKQVAKPVKLTLKDFVAVVELDHGCYAHSSSLDELACRAEKLKQHNRVLAKKLKRAYASKETLVKKVPVLKSTIEDLRSANKYALSLSTVLNRITASIREQELEEARPMSPPSSAATSYSPEIRQFAMTLALDSSAAYEYVRKTFNYNLPCIKTVRRWFNSSNSVDPGFNADSFETLHQLAELSK